MGHSTRTIAAVAALRPVVDHQSVHRKRQLGIDRHHPAIGDDQAAGLHGIRRNQDLGPLQSCCLDDDIGVAARVLELTRSTAT